jgi:hypothetical protein
MTSRSVPRSLDTGDRLLDTNHLSSQAVPAAARTGTLGRPASAANLAILPARQRLPGRSNGDSYGRIVATVVIGATFNLNGLFIRYFLGEAPYIGDRPVGRTV